VRYIVKFAALVCLMLTLCSALTFATHHHSKGTDSASCTVCVAAHSSAPKSTANLLKAIFTPIFTFRAEPIVAKHVFVAFALSVRPPPVF
jgi:hypothetical protein